jgi:histone H3/H4
MSESAGYFKHCSTCKAPIAFGAKYFVCSVSTCNRPKLAMFFCSLPCWEAHVPEARHRDAWAEPAHAPSAAEHGGAAQTGSSQSASQPARPRIVQMESTRALTATHVESEDDVLVVVSKLKRYIRERSEMNTSDTVVAPLSDHLRALCNEAIRNAARDGRKTVMDRDFLPLFSKKSTTSD